jgi:hypothetical protein
MKKLLLLFAMLSGIKVFAQLSFEPRQFAIDLEDYMNKSGKSEYKDAASEFVGYYTGKFNNNQKIQIINLTNEQINRGFGYGLISNYLLSMNGLIVNNQLGSFDNWHKAARIALTESKEAFANYVEFSRNTFYDKILAKTGAAVWMIDNMEINMDMRGTPAIMFKNTNVYSYTAGDTITIFRTSGKFLPASNEWKGSGGAYFWTRVGMDSSQISAELKSYTINFDKGELVADTAILVYPKLLSEAVEGKLFDKPFAKSMGDKSQYPKFQTHRRNFVNLPFGEGKLTGGFALTGKTLRGIGTDTSKAELWFYYKKKPVLKVLSDDFVVKNDRVNTMKAEVMILLDKDTITHPQVQFYYRFIDRFIQMYRTREGISQAPFYDSYHKFEFYVDEVRWNMDDPKIELDMTNDNEPAKFESFNYFRDYRYEKLQGMLEYNPLERIKRYAEKRGVNGFTIKEYAADFRAVESDVRVLMTQLNDLGYIDYNVKKQYVTVKRKLKDYVNAHYGRTDYDAIAFFSIIKRYPNATISLVNNDLQIQGVPKFDFSDSQNVYVIPKDQIVTLKKNRGMDFSGKIRAGKVEFYGSGYEFDYTKFQVRLNNIDSMKFYYRDVEKGIDVPIKSTLADVYGTLSIDHPANKSGRKKIPGYPIFKSDKGSNIYYDKPTTQQGVYAKEKFYFEVDPFTLDSLTELDFKTLTLPGTMRAANIVPDFRYEVSVQPDLSMGFVKADIPDGYPLYGGKGRGFVILSLSDLGFFGNGTIRYVASNSKSDEFIFLIDSMNANCKAFENDRTLKFPTAKASNTYNHWMPYQDTMFVTPLNEQMVLSDARATLDGTLIVSPEKMGANGKINITEAQLYSKNFWLQTNNILSDTAQFRIIDKVDTTKFSFNSSTVTCNVDLNARSGNFIYHNKGINTYFNYNQFVASFDRFIWRIDERDLDFRAYKLNNEDASFMLSARTVQDSLRFNTSQTKLDLKDFTIYANKIPLIRIADGFVYPDSNKIVVRKDAAIDVLHNAKIVADTIQKFHAIEKSNVNILGRFAIEADGVYQYIDSKKQVQTFFMNTIRVDAKKRIAGKTNIPDSANFYVGKKLRFYGNANLVSVIKNLEYEGFFLPVHELERPKSDWFRNAAIINPDSVYVIVNPDIRNEKRQAMMAGINIANDSTHIYPLFFSRKRAGSDPELMRVNGVLYYDEKLDIFKMGSYERVFKGETSGNYMEVSEGKKQVYYEGEFNTGVQNGQFAFFTGGKGKYNVVDTSFAMQVAALINFPLPNDVTRIMFDTLNYQSGSASPTVIDPQILKPALTAYLKDEKDRIKVIEELDDKSIRLINQLQSLLFFSELEFKWDQQLRALVTTGELSLNSIEKFKIERKINGRIQIIKKRTGDDVVIYLESPEGSWYYFKYQKGIMYALSSDKLFNQYVRDNMDKLSKKYDNYKLRLGNIADRNKFVRIYKTEKRK